MNVARLEHVNLTVEDPDATAAELVRVFGWTIRWSGGSIHGGRSVHVGSAESYVALYTLGRPERLSSESYHRHQGLNHLGVVVDDLDALEARVVAAGYEPHSHQEYDPGRRFYFHTREGIEIEVLSYG